MTKVKTTNPDLIIEEEDGSITTEGWADDIEANKEYIHALVRIKAGNPGFSCKKCGTWFKPQPRQLIFYELCDTCFARFGKTPSTSLWSR